MIVATVGVSASVLLLSVDSSTLLLFPVSKALSLSEILLLFDMLSAGVLLLFSDASTVSSCMLLLISCVSILLFSPSSVLTPDVLLFVSCILSSSELLALSVLAVSLVSLVSAV